MTFPIDRGLLAHVTQRDAADPDARDLAARSIWSGIVEPGDRVAWMAVDALGAAPALDALIDKWDAPHWSAALDGGATPQDMQLAIERWMPRLDLAASTRALRQAVRCGARLLVPGDPLWSVGVDDLGEHAPLALWVRGTDEALLALNRSIALVGARAATGYGEHVTMEASAGLVDRGYAIASGAAYGIDGMAHRAALASNGMTIAFLAGGVDRFYPSGHDALLTRISEVGAVISELPCGSAPTKWRFLQRNRLIAAASRATIVLEAGWRSGSLNTAHHARELGRPIGAVPGPVTSAASAGCHKLLREEIAICVTNPDEMAELAPLAPTVQPALFDDQTYTDDRSRLLDAMSYRAPRVALDIAKRSGLSVAGVQALLGELELDERVAERERGWLRITPAREKEKEKSNKTD